MSLLVPLIIFVIAAAMAMSAGWRLSPPIVTSPWLLPLIVGVAMALVSLALIGGELGRRFATAGASHARDISERPASPARVAGWLALSAGYAVATPLVGFEGATVVFLVLALKVFGGASWRLTLGVAVAIAVLLPLIFRRVFFTLVP